MSSLIDSALAESERRTREAALSDAEKLLEQAASLLRTAKQAGIAVRVLALKGEVEIVQKKIARARV